MLRCACLLALTAIGAFAVKTLPEDIEKLVCEFASQKQIEDKAIDEVCSLIEQKIPSVKKEECSAASELAWDRILKMCPKGRMTYLAKSGADPVDDIEKLVCKFATQKQIEDKAIDEVCSLIEQKIPSIKKSECTVAAELAWDKVVKLCPKGRMSYLAKSGSDPVDDIEKLVCKFATQKQIEDKAIDEVCSLIEQKVPSVKKAECMVAAELAWNKVVKLCPKGRMSYLAKSGSHPVDDIEKLVCKFATQKQIEDKAIDEVCSLIEEKIPSIKKEECSPAAEMAWDRILKMCPKSKQFVRGPVQNIERLVCRFASQKQIEDKAVDEVCSLIAQKMPAIKKEECTPAADMAWDRILKMCPKGLGARYGPKDIEKLVCKFATQKQIEDKAIDEVCSLIEEKIPSIKKEGCSLAAEMAWDRILKMCPKSKQWVRGPVQNIERLVCRFASQKQIEDKAVDEVCSLIAQKMPAIKKEECTPAVDMAWDRILKMCPKGLGARYGPKDVERLVCKFATQKQIEDKAIDEVCSLIEEKIPSMKKEECSPAAEMAWDRIVKFCPKAVVIV